MLNLAVGQEHSRSTVVYCRVSSSGQRDNLESQVASLDQFCVANGITVANSETLSPQQELAEDLVAIVHMFSGRLSGLRRYEKQLKAEFGGES